MTKNIKIEIGQMYKDKFGKIYIYDIKKDTVYYINFAAAKGYEREVSIGDVHSFKKDTLSEGTFIRIK